MSLQNKSNCVLGLGFNCKLVKDIKIPLLIIAFCDNSEFSEVVTLNSSGGVFALEVFSIRKQITVSTLFSAAFNLVGDLFVLPRVLHVN